MRAIRTEYTQQVAYAVAMSILAVALAAVPASAGDYQPTKDEIRDYSKPCPACPTCPQCPEQVTQTTVEEDETRFRFDMKGGVLTGVGATKHRIDYGAMAEPTFGVKLTDDLDLEASYMLTNNGVDNPGHRTSTVNIHCGRGGPRINADAWGIELYGNFKVGYCHVDGLDTGFSEDNLVVGPGGGFAIPVADNVQITAGTDLLWFTRGGRENTAITPNASVRFKF
jgi:hypothetical protein